MDFRAAGTERTNQAGELDRLVDRPGMGVSGRHDAVRRLGLLILVLGFSVAVVFALAAVATFRFSILRYVEAASTAVYLVEDSITRTLESAETSLLAVGAAVRRGPAGNPQAQQDVLRRLLSQSLQFAPYLRQIVVVDRHGHILIDSASRETGRRLDLDELAQVADVTVPSPESGPPLYRGLRIGVEVPGRFLPIVGEEAGVAPVTLVPMVVSAGPDLLVVAAINPITLRTILGEAQFGPRGAVRLVRLDGRPLVAAEDPSTSILGTRRLSLMSMVRDGREGGQVVIRDEAGGFFPKGRMVFKVSSRYPVAVMVVVARSDMLNRWLEATGTLLFWGVVTLVVLGVGGGLLLRESLKRVRLEGRLHLIGLTERVFGNSAEAMLVTDRRDTILAANPAFLKTTGRDVADVLGARPGVFLSPAGSDPGHDLADGGAVGGAVGGTEGGAEGGADPPVDPGPGHWWLESASGPRRAVELRSAPLNRDATIITLNDITDQIRVRQDLRAALREAELANRAKSDFLASMSHELRTPLNAILGFSEIIRDQMFGPVGSARYIDYANDIHGSGTHLRDIINDLLDLARIEAGKLDLHPEPLDVNDEVDVCCRLVRERATNHRLTLTFTDRANPARLTADRRLFRQMLFNLLSNAIKFTPAGGYVFVSCVNGADGRMIVSVRDTGVGIPEAEQARIFQSYERAVNTTTRQIEGSGLGLALVRSMMLLHGGTVTVDSTVGRGSTFTLVFPPARPAAPNAGG